MLLLRPHPWVLLLRLLPHPWVLQLLLPCLWMHVLLLLPHPWMHVLLLLSHPWMHVLLLPHPWMHVLLLPHPWMHVLLLLTHRPMIRPPPPVRGVVPLQVRGGGWLKGGGTWPHVRLRWDLVRPGLGWGAGTSPPSIRLHHDTKTTCRAANGNWGLGFPWGFPNLVMNGGGELMRKRVPRLHLRGFCRRHSISYAPGLTQEGTLFPGRSPGSKGRDPQILLLMYWHDTVPLLLMAKRHDRPLLLPLMLTHWYDI